jgi:short-subunit dehydrogenase
VNTSKQTHYALVTGASGGIGYQFAQLFARDGHDLVLVARNETKLNKIKRFLESVYGITAVVIASDLSQPKAAAELHAETKRRGIAVNHLVNNAGFGDLSGYLDREWDRHRQLAQLNMMSLMQLTYLYGRDMRTEGFGRILNVSSVASMAAGPNMAMYYASKAFVRSLSEAVHEELRGTGVTVTALCPGPVSTGFEKAAQMSGKNFFTLAKPATPEHVAAYGYRKMLRGSALAYPNAIVHAANIASRLVPRSWSRKVCMRVNGTPQAK